MKENATWFQGLISTYHEILYFCLKENLIRLLMNKIKEIVYFLTVKKYKKAKKNKVGKIKNLNI